MIAKGKINTLSEFDKVKINSFAADILQFDKLGIRIGWVIHDLGDTKRSGQIILVDGGFTTGATKAII